MAAAQLLAPARCRVLNEKLVEVMGDDITQKQARSVADGTPATCAATRTSPSGRGRVDS